MQCIYRVKESSILDQVEANCITLDELFYDELTFNEDVVLHAVDF